LAEKINIGLCLGRRCYQILRNTKYLTEKRTEVQKHGNPDKAGKEIVQ